MIEDEWIRSKEPISIQKRFFELHANKNTQLKYCPAVKNALKNLYGLQSIYDYSFVIENGKIYYKNYDSEFFQKHVYIRDIDHKFFSFTQNYIFFSEESVELTTYLHPFLEENEVAEKTYSVIGKYNIGKWFRVIEFPFYLKKKYNEFSIKNDDIYTYIQFNTDKNINFKKFYPTEKIKNFSNSTFLASNGIKLGSRLLEDYYKYFKFKKNILKEIKQNIIE